MTSAPPRPSDRDFPVPPPPSIDRDGWDAPPLLFDERLGAVTALSGRPDGKWDALVLREQGGGEPRFEARLPPDRTPRLDAGAGRLLDAYLGYVARRDAFLWGLYAELDAAHDPPALSDRAESALRGLGAQVLSRAVVLRPGTVPDDPARLGTADVARGIRATDAESLDRPTLGRIL